MLDLLPFIGGGKAVIEFFLVMRRLDEAIKVGDEKEADRLSVEAAGLLIALGIGGAIRIPGLARLPTKLPGAPELAAWLQRRQGQRHRERLHDASPDPRSSTYIPPASTIAKLDREVDEFAKTVGTWNTTLEGRKASAEYLERARRSGNLKPGEIGHYPYATGTKAIDVTMTKELTLVRVGRHPNDGTGDWLMRGEDFDAYRNQLYAAERIRDRVAIPNEPIYFAEVTVPPGTRLRIGTANAHDTYGRGWGVQVEVVQRANPEWFNKPQLIARGDSP